MLPATITARSGGALCQQLNNPRLPQPTLLQPGADNEGVRAGKMGCFVSTTLLSSKRLCKSLLAPSELARDDSPAPFVPRPFCTNSSGSRSDRNPCRKQMWMSLLQTQGICLVFIQKLFYLFPTSLFFKLLLLCMYNFKLFLLSSAQAGILLQIHPAVRSPQLSGENLLFCPRDQWE